MLPSYPIAAQEVGLPPEKATVQTVTREGHQIDLTVASEPLQPGDLALRIPERLVVTLDRIFEDGAVAELLTTNKLRSAQV